MHKVRKGVSGMVVAILTALVMGLFATAPANAAAYPKGVYAPTLADGWAVEGWANVNTDCEGTFGCWVFVKIERYNPYIFAGGWEYLGGYWASPGWNYLAVPAPVGCAYYHLVVNSYNDAPSNNALGVNLGHVQATFGGGVKRYVSTVRSDSSWICPTA